MIGIIKTRPGPLMPSNLPNRKMTIRWYSGMIFIADARIVIKKITMINNAITIVLTSTINITSPMLKN
jgi:hypothetical protein